ncbi:MAG: dTMP kinase [Fervidicoccaceae archaeon]
MGVDELFRKERILKPGTVLRGKKTIDEKELLEPSVTLIPKEERRGKYVAIEGIDGSGKTTLSNLICRKMSEAGEKCEIVREPFYEEIKALLHKMPNMNPIAEAYLFAADRLIMHTEKLIRLLREDEIIVIGDRSYLASLVYQSTRGAPLEIILSINSFAVEPDAIILLDVDPGIAWERLKKKGDRQLQHLEAREILGKLRETYLKLSSKIESPPIDIIDASLPPEEVLERALEILRKRKLI